MCDREWNLEFCDKKKYKCAECPNRQFAPLSYEYIYNHLAGKDAFCRDVIGVYPILMDNTCYFLCADFDDKSCEHGYKNDVLTFVGVCNEWGINSYIERSCSGNGAHVWIVLGCFFVAAPIAWYFTSRWLEQFANRIAMPWWIYLVALVVVLIVTVGLVTLRSWKAATENPADVVKNN